MRSGVSAISSAFTGARKANAPGHCTASEDLWEISNTFLVGGTLGPVGTAGTLKWDHKFAQR